ncbi:DNA topoisomerase 6 subunit B [Spatholobus suberectus]|nr:DNA topoisomerase 6 subunit B [Spatholobus suberectus]
MIGLVDHERVDAALYDDYETEKVREVIECAFQQDQGQGASLDNMPKNVLVGKGTVLQKQSQLYCVQV